MSTPIPKPAYVAGTNASSGSVQTAEISFVRGGGRSYSLFSGNLPSLILSGGGDILIYSGAGRVNSFIMHTQMNSGLAAVYYDAAVATSGGPFPASGHKFICSTPPTWGGGTAGGSGAALAFNPSAVPIDMVFQSGLCVNIRSGVPGHTITFNTEVSANFAGV